MSLVELQELDSQWAMQTYARNPLELVRGEGARVWDDQGRPYLDFFAGLAVCNTGHCHPAVVKAIEEQARRLLHTSNLFYSEPTARLAERLSDSSLEGKAFLCNSGAEANECAIKLARKHARGRGVEAPEILTLEGGFHGRTMGALAATPQESKQAPFAPMLTGFRAVPRNDPDALAAAAGQSTAAILIEPVQGESGVHPISEEVLVTARQACDRTGALLVFDEIQTGMGRTGSLWAYEQAPVRPDVITVAKALASGLPIGACVAGPAAADVLSAGDHGSTFAGNPVACAAALATLDVIDDPQLLRRVRELGTRLAEGLQSLEGIVEVRCRGLMVGADVDAGSTAPELVARLISEGLLANATGPATLRFLPPLTIGEAEVDEALAILGKVL